MSSNDTAQTCANYQSLKDNGSSGVVQSVVEKLQNRNTCRSVGDILEIPDDAEKHGNHETPAGDKSNSNGSHDCDGYHAFWLMDFFRKMRRTVETCKCPICVYESCNKSDSSVAPASVVDKSRENELGRLMTWCSCGYSGQYHDERYQGTVKTGSRNRGQDLAVAVEQEADPCENEVSHKDMIVLDDIFGMRELPAADQSRCDSNSG